YDVTKQLSRGDHAIGMIVGDGWYIGHVAWAGRQNYGPKPMGLAQLEIDYADGSRETVVTDNAWAGLIGMSPESYGGPIQSSDLLMGENYDARLEIPLWAQRWPNNARIGGFANVVEEPIGAVPLVPQVNEPVRVLEVLSAKKMTEPKAGAFVFDLGQNMVGHVRLQVQGPAGTRVQLRHAEMLNPDGTIYTTNLRRAAATDTYILKGEGVETWEPRFTFHGFRYVEVTGFPGRPRLEALKGIVVGSDSPKVGTFTTSNILVNQLQHNIFWGQRGNYLEAPTDCPQRDERLGWMGDAQVFIRTATFNNDVAAFMTKWTQDVEDGQSAEGAFPDVSPKIGVGNDGAPAWGDAGVIVPWTMYLAYGDKRLLARRYDSMKRWVDYIHKNNPDLIWTKRVGNNYGDWLNLNDETPKEVVATAYFQNSVGILSQAAEVLGKKEESKEYNELAGRIVDTFFASFYKPDGTIKGDTQTAYVLPIAFNFYGWANHFDKGLPATKKFRETLARRKDHLSTGFLGAGHLNLAVSRAVGTELAYKLLLNEDYPGWLYPVKNGATTIWERWDGWTDAKGFQDPGMNSFNHYSYGAIGEWLYREVGGLGGYWYDASQRHFRFSPRPGKGITSAKASWESIVGRVECEWQSSGTNISIKLRVPANSTGSLLLPKNMASAIVDGKPSESGFLIQLPSGRHTITARLSD
ncbi:MAG: family 78 glycoside hydrolase catalytic domain, partial [Fimbriimonas sp.]